MSSNSTLKTLENADEMVSLSKEEFIKLTAVKDKLNETQNLLEAIFISSINGIQIFKSIRNNAGEIIDFEWVMANPVVTKFNGEVLGQCLLVKKPAFIESGKFDAFKKVVETGEPLHYQHLYQHNGNNWFETTVVKRDDGLIVTFLDITELKKKEQDFKQQTLFVQSIARATADIIFIMDVNTKEVTYRNRNVAEELGYSKEDIKGMKESFFDLMHEEDKNPMIGHIEEIKKAKDGEVREIEYRMRDANGSWRWYIDRNTVSKRSEEGKVIEKIGISQNITEKKQQEEQILKQLNILNEAESIADIGSWEYDISTKNFKWSEGMYRLFNIPGGSHVTPKIYFEFIPKEENDKALQIFKHITEDFKPFEETLNIKTTDGLRKIIKVKSLTVNNKDGKPEKVLGIDMNITETILAAEQLKIREAQLSTLVENTPDVIARWDKNRKLVFANKAFEIESGIPGSLSLGKTTIEMNQPPEIAIPFMDKIAQVARTGKPAKHYNEFITTQGKRLFFSHLVPEFNNDEKVETVLSISRDISELKKAEEELKELNHVLQHKNSALENLNKELSAFAFIASHDLAEPLRKIKMFTNRIIETEDESLSSTAKSYFKRILSAEQRMDALINDILNFSRITTHNSEQDLLKLDNVLKIVKTDLKEIIKKSGVMIQADILPAIKGSQTNFVRLFSNLLDNALKYRKPDDTPIIKITYQLVRSETIKHADAKPNATYHKISFIDNGIGFDNEYADKIFHMFQRLHSIADYPGTGIGLAICKKIMEKHNGFITAEGKEGEGATFTCYIPETK